jgi:hypothetical protein
MPLSAVKIVRSILAAAVGIAVLFIGDDASSTGASLIAPAHARAGHAPMPPTGVARRTHRRAVLNRTIPLDLGYSAGAAAYYGYAPGTYGGVGCYRSSRGELVCP